MSSITPENQNLSQFVGKVFGDDWEMAAHSDENGRLVTYVLSGRDKENPGVISHSTIGLSDYKLGQDKSDIALGAELVGACHDKCDYFDLGLAASASIILGNRVLCKPGTIFANVLPDGDGKSLLKHFLFTVPSFWNDQLYPLKFKAKTVLWLQALPISDSEMELAQREGPGVLGDKLLSENADLMDIERAPVV